MDFPVRWTLNNMLQIKDLYKYFGGVRAVDSCDFSIEPKKITALIGPNGSGKTTVFNLVSGLIKPDKGEIIFSPTDGKKYNLEKYSIDKISNFGISRVFQQTRLFKNLTVGENLLLAIDNLDMGFWKNFFGLNSFSRKKMEKAKKILSDFRVSEIWEQKAGDLSFGQKRLAELARTILNPHELLMLDEPVAGVNPRIRDKIADILLGLREQGETILLIEHDMAFTLSIADFVVVMDAGKVIAQGKPEEIKTNPRVLEAYLGGD